jgi:hypothetical protein
MSFRALTRAQLGASLALDGQRLLSEAEVAAMRDKGVPLVQRGCICPNQHRPDKDGFITTSPSCVIHGLRTFRATNA